MAWEDTMVRMLRVIINDESDGTPTYSDERLENVLVVAAHYVNQEVDGFSNTYTINITSPDISPDPTLTATLEEEFTNFTVLKAACITDQGLFRTKALAAGIKVKCGPAVLETLKHIDGFKQLLSEGPCSAYAELKNQWAFGNNTIVKAILSPFVSNNFDPRSLSGIGLSDHARNRHSLY